MIWKLRWHYLRFRSVLSRLLRVAPSAIRMVSSCIAAQYHHLRLFTPFIHYAVSFTNFVIYFWHLAVPRLRHFLASHSSRIRPFCAGIAVDSSSHVYFRGLVDPCQHSISAPHVNIRHRRYVMLVVDSAFRASFGCSGVIWITPACRTTVVKFRSDREFDRQFV